GTQHLGEESGQLESRGTTAVRTNRGGRTHILAMWQVPPSLPQTPSRLQSVPQSNRKATTRDQTRGPLTKLPGQHSLSWRIAPQGEPDRAECSRLVRQRNVRSLRRPFDSDHLSSEAAPVESKHNRTIAPFDHSLGNEGTRASASDQNMS